MDFHFWRGTVDVLQWGGVPLKLCASPDGESLWMYRANLYSKRILEWLFGVGVIEYLCGAFLCTSRGLLGQALHYQTLR